MSETILKMENISKSFAGVPALSDIHFEVEKGEVHALIGENGAGKSTMMKIILGIHRPDQGEMTFKGAPYAPHRPMDALGKGISMIHQEISLAENMTVAENIWVGREPLRRGFVDAKKLKAQTKQLLEELDIAVDYTKKVGALNVAQQQMVEIARAISYDSDLIIMDEPTSALTETETQNLFDIIRKLKETGVSVIIITHKLDEIFTISDRITVLRDGRFIATKPTAETTEQELITMMVGRELNTLYPKQTAQIGEAVLAVEGYSRKGVFSDVSFEVRRGEILGVAGLMGAGRSEIMRAVFGVDPHDTGALYMDGKPIQIHSPKQAIRHGLAMVTEDRKLSGLSLVRSVRENISVTNLGRYLRGIFLSGKRESEDIKKMIDMLSIRLSKPSQMVNSLSGGNQQKVIIARWLLTGPRVLILDEPTRGIDVGAKSEVHRIISELACQGMAVIMISSELPEILGMSDRVIVIHDGKIRGTLMREEATQQKIMEYAVQTDGGE